MPAPKVASPPADDPRLQRVDRSIRRFRHRPDALIEVLHTAQQAYGYLPRDVLRHVAAALRLPESRVFGVATFYHFFTLCPQGQHSCIVCTGTACYVKGAGQIVAALEADCGIAAGQTTADGRLSLGKAYCVGDCSLAPMFTFDDRVFGPETPAAAVARVQKLLGEQRDQE